MQRIISTVVGVFSKAVLLVAIACLFNVVGLFGLFEQPSYADVLSPQQAIKEIEKDQAIQNPKKVYEQATELSQDPKMGVEKKYEENVKEYYQEHPEEGGLVEEAKELIDKVTGKE